MYKVPKVVKLSKSEARWRHGVWIRSIEASYEHLIRTPMGVIKARARTALPEGQRFEAEAIDEMHTVRGGKIRHETDVEEQSDEDPMELYDEDPAETVEQIAVAHFHHHGTICTEVRTTP